MEGKYNVVYKITHWAQTFCRQHFRCIFINWKYLYFDYSFFLSVQLTINQHWCKKIKWLGADQVSSHYLNQCWSVINSLMPDDIYLHQSTGSSRAQVTYCLFSTKAFLAGLSTGYSETGWTKVLSTRVLHVIFSSYNGTCITNGITHNFNVCNFAWIHIKQKYYSWGPF